jgi:hypothetical protein
LGSETLKSRRVIIKPINAKRTIVAAEIQKGKLNIETIVKNNKTNE